MADAPRVAQLRDTFEPLGAEVVGVTAASREDVERFVLEDGGRYPVLANADAERDAWGVSMVWGSVYYLVDPRGLIVVEGLDAAEAHLRAEFDVPDTGEWGLSP